MLAHLYCPFFDVPFQSLADRENNRHESRAKILNTPPFERLLKTHIVCLADSGNLPWTGTNMTIYATMRHLGIVVRYLGQFWFRPEVVSNSQGFIVNLTSYVFEFYVCSDAVAWGTPERSFRGERRFQLLDPFRWVASISGRGGAEWCYYCQGAVSVVSKWRKSCSLQCGGQAWKYAVRPAFSLRRVLGLIKREINMISLGTWSLVKRNTTEVYCERSTFMCGTAWIMSLLFMGVWFVCRDIV